MEVKLQPSIHTDFANNFFRNIICFAQKLRNYLGTHPDFHYK